MLLTELHAHAFEQFAVAASDRAADLSIWVWQLMPRSVSNSHSCSHSNTTVSTVVLTQGSIISLFNHSHSTLQSLPFGSQQLQMSSHPN